MALYPKVLTASAALTSGGLHIHKMELIPDGGSMEIRFLNGTDSTGTEKYRLKATEDPEERDFPGGLLIKGPVYFYIYNGAGALTLSTEEEI